jgi:protein TonB
MFRGGESALRKFLQENVRYPESAAEAGIEIEGRVIVTFKVEKDGSLSDIKVVRGLGPEFDEEALRVVKMMPKWLPAHTGGKVSVARYTLPIIFKKNN